MVESYGGSLQSMNDYLVTPQDRDAFHSWVRSNFRPMMEKVGSANSAAEKGDASRLRSDLIGILGGIGEDPQTIQQATRLAEQYLADPNSVDPTIISTALAVAAHNGNAALFDKYLAALRQVNSPRTRRWHGRGSRRIGRRWRRRSPCPAGWTSSPPRETSATPSPATTCKNSLPSTKFLPPNELSSWPRKALTPVFTIVTINRTTWLPG